jgi:hypothetical protein
VTPDAVIGGPGGEMLVWSNATLNALVGDFVKTTINTAIPCGARIGIAATVSDPVPERVPAFTNMAVPGGERTTAEQAAIVLERMMARRGLEFLDADREFIRQLAAFSTAP